MGFSGTLGQGYSLTLLRDVYNAVSIVIPELYVKRFHRLPDISLPTRQDWMEEILYSARNEAIKGRAVLVICETIKLAQELSFKLHRANSFPPNNYAVKLYTMNGRGQEQEIQSAQPRDIIVATNLGTRGTDIKANCVEGAGGLHVILTYVPASQRVEMQAWGRTSRQGNRGSGQLIILHDPENPLERRNEMEERRLLDFKESQLPLIHTKDVLFARFQKTLAEIRWHLKTSSSLRRNPYVQNLVLSANEERWAIFLKKLDDGELSAAQATEEYERLEKSIRERPEDLEATLGSIRNCYYWIRCGNYYYLKDRCFNDDARTSMQYFEKAIETDRDFAAVALYGKASALLKGYVNVIRRNYHEGSYKQQAIMHLTKCVGLLEQELEQLGKIQQALIIRTRDVHSDLYAQTVRMYQFTEKYFEYVRHALTTVERSLRPVDCTGENPETEVTMRITHGSDEIKPEGFSKYKLTFHYLTHFQDITVQDQAVKTIEQAFRFNRESIHWHGKISFRIPKGQVKLDLNDAIQPGITVNISVDNVMDISGITVLREALGNPVTQVKISGASDQLAAVLRERFLRGYQVKILSDVPWDGSKSTRIDVLPPPQNDSDFELLTGDKQAIIVDWLVFSAHVEEFISCTSNGCFSVEFYDVGHEPLREAWKDALSTFSDISLTLITPTWETSAKLVPTLRELGIEFALGFDGLSFEQARVLLRSADRQEEKIQQVRLDQLSKQFLQGNNLPEELQQLVLRGMDVVPTFSEQNFVPWKSITVACGLGVLQIAAGALLSWNVGGKLVTEGGGDLAMIARAGRNFTWSEYKTHKVTSVFTSIIGGSSVGKLFGTSAGGETVREVGEQCVTSLVRNEAQLTPSALKSAASKLLRSVGKAGVKDVGNIAICSALESVGRFTFDTIHDVITTKVQEWVVDIVSADEFSKTSAPFFAIQAVRPSLQPQKLLESWLHETTAGSVPDINFKLFQLSSLLCKTILSDSNSWKTPVIFVLNASAAITGLSEMYVVTDKVCQHVLRRMKEEIRDWGPSYILQCVCHWSAREADRLVQVIRFRDRDHFEVDDLIQGVPFDAQKMDQALATFNQIHNACKGFTTNSVQTQDFARQMADFIAGQIVTWANRCLQSPTMLASIAEAATGLKIQKRVQGGISTSHVVATRTNETSSLAELGFVGGQHQAVGNNLSDLESTYCCRMHASGGGDGPHDPECEEELRREATVWLQNRRPRRANDFLKDSPGARH